MKGIIIEKNHEHYPWILYLHGWGQNKESLQMISNATKDFANAILIDLPGFGEVPLTSTYDIEDYIAYIQNILQEEKIIPSLIIGHSFGGKLAAFYALTVQDISLLLLAPSIIEPKKRWKTKWKKKMYRFFRWLQRHKIIRKIPKSLRGSRDYQQSKGYLRSTFVHVVHRYLSHELKNIHSPVWMMIGKDDEEVSVEQMERASQQFANAQLEIVEGNHFAYRRYPEMIANHAKALLEKNL